MSDIPTQATLPSTQPPNLPVKERPSQTAPPLGPPQRTHTNERKAAGILRERLRIFNLFLAVFFAFFLVISALRYQIFPFPGYDPTLAVLSNGLALLLSVGTFVILRDEEPSSLRLQTVQWVTLFELVLYCVWFTLEKLFDNREEILSRFLAEHPIFAGTAFSFSWFGMMVCYGAFLPNQWKRLACQIAFFVVVPVVVCLLAPAFDARLQGAIGAGFYQSMLGVLVLGGGTVVYSCYHENRLRQDVIEARRVGAYRLKEKLGEGGMGVVYRAEHQLVKRPCAIKFIHPSALSDPGQRQRFFREFQALARLSHWNFVEVFDYGETPDGTLYYVMECLDGIPLDQLVRQNGPLPAGRVLYLLRQVCDALRMAHRLGLIHRDLKPSNLFLTSKGGSHDVIKVLDFGLVHDSEHALSGDTLTQHGAIMGTPGYMPPEQAEGLKQIGPRSDIYSLGAVGYYLLSGRAPYLGKSVAEILVAQLMTDPPPLSEIQPPVPADVIALLECCLARDPQVRYADVDSVLAAIDSCACVSEWSAQKAEAWHLERTAATVSQPDPTRTLNAPHAPPATSPDSR